jgi:hypothetical protein
VLVPYGELVALEAWIDGDWLVIVGNIVLGDVPTAALAAFLAVLRQHIAIHIGKVRELRASKRQDSTLLPTKPETAVSIDTRVESFWFSFGNQKQ